MKKILFLSLTLWLSLIVSPIRQAEAQPNLGAGIIAEIAKTGLAIENTPQSVRHVRRYYRYNRSRYRYNRYGYRRHYRARRPAIRRSYRAGYYGNRGYSNNRGYYNPAPEPAYQYRPYGNQPSYT